MRARFVLVYQDQRVPLPDGEVVIGRSVACQVRFNAPTVSRRHLVLRIDGDHEDGELLLFLRREELNGSLEDPQRQRADVRAVRVAEVDREEPSSVVLAADGFAVGAGELEGRHRRRWLDERPVERRAGLKRWAGHPLFIYAGLTTFFRHYDRRRPHFSVRFPDGDGIDDGYFSVACNTNPYTYVGNRPFDIAPDAHLDNGLAMVSVRSLRADRLLRIMARALRADGSLARDRHIHYRPDVDAFVVEGTDGRPFPYQIDGDYLGEIARIEFRHVPEAMDLVLPVGSSA